MQTLFHDRTEAGALLAKQLAAYARAPGAIVLALPRGGVPVGAAIAEALGLPLDVLVVRKLGVPTQPELAMGAIASGGGVYLNDSVIAHGRIGRQVLERVAQRERVELQRQEEELRGARPPLDVRGRTVVLVDDGVATGSTMIAGMRALQTQSPARLVVAVPVAPPDTAEFLQELADDFVCLEAPADFAAVGQFYARFPQVADAEVRRLLADHTAAGR